MPDKYYLTGKAKCRIIVTDVEFDVEGYGQTEQEAKDDARQGIIAQVETHAQYALGFATHYNAQVEGFEFLSTDIEEVDQTPMERF